MSWPVLTPREEHSMIVKRLTDLAGTGQEIDTANWTSRRLLLAGDGMGFSLHDTLIKAGTETAMRYRHHLEAVYCVEGEGEVETVADGRVYPLRPGTLYALDQNDPHVLRARTQLRMICVFNPPLTGREVHDANGAYPRAETNVARATTPVTS
jgi:L-ectoine synthase